MTDFFGDGRFGNYEDASLINAGKNSFSSSKLCKDMTLNQMLILEHKQILLEM